MQIDYSILKSEEDVIFKLRGLYRKYGYSCFKMSKFEEYDLYSQNKDFLVSDGVITFNDTNGKLMALKPDVTLSIVKNYREAAGVERVYYNENVYRISEKTSGYKEIMQTGLECLGDIDGYNLCEVVGLAALSLEGISEKSVLNISHLGVVSEILFGIKSESARRDLLKCIGEKNAHGIDEICERCGAQSVTKELLKALTEAYGTAREVSSKIRELTDNRKILDALELLELVSEQVQTVTKATVRADLSLINDMNYYNGIVFQGFIEGAPSVVLSGGQYDKLMEKMGKKAGGIGFAVYLDLLERLKEKNSYDVDVLLLYRAEDDIKAVRKRAAELVAQGKSVSVQKSEPEKLVSREKEVFGE